MNPSNDTVLSFPNQRRAVSANVADVEWPGRTPTPASIRRAQLDACNQRMSDRKRLIREHEAELQNARKTSFEQGHRKGYMEGVWWGMVPGLVVGGLVVAALAYLAQHVGQL